MSDDKTDALNMVDPILGTFSKAVYPALTLMTPRPINMIFTNDNGEKVGKFEYDKDKKKWTFEGDCDESAKLFVKLCMAHFQSIIDGNRDGLI